MTTIPEDGPWEPKIAIHKYETLRANALGDINRAVDFTLFLRNGMSAWASYTSRLSQPEDA